MGYRGCWTLRMSRLHCGFFFLFPPSPFMCSIRHLCCGTKNENQSLKMIRIGIPQDKILFWRWVLFLPFTPSVYMNVVYARNRPHSENPGHKPTMLSSIFLAFIKLLIDLCLLNLIKIVAYFNWSMPKKRLLGNALLLSTFPDYNFQRQRKTAMQIFVKTLTGKTITLEVSETS